MENVVSARLGLTEILYPDGNSEFTYTVGIECSSDEQEAIQQAVEVLRSVPPSVATPFFVWQLKGEFPRIPDNRVSGT
jgi:hypothetical protein